MYRARFEANFDDYRSINWPVKYPYWCTGYAGDDSYSVVVAYVDSIEEVYANWPEANNIDMGDEVSEFSFTDRFPKPDWFEEEK